MRKVGHIFTTFLYLILSIGISLNSHYCGGQLLETYVYATPECAFCDFDYEGRENDDCCDDESELISVDENQQVLSKISVNNRINVLLYDVSETRISSGNGDTNTIVFDDSSPPDLAEDLTTLYSNFTFYG